MSALRPLIVIGILLAACGFADTMLGEYVGPLEYIGYLVFDYPEGVNPMNNIVFNVDPIIAYNLIIVDVPSPWSYSYSAGSLTLSGGSLQPGGVVSVMVSLNKYFEGGEYSVSSLGTTTAGEMSEAMGALLVGELYLLRAIAMASAYRNPLAAMVVLFIFLDLILTLRRKRPAVEVIEPIVHTDYETRSELAQKLSIEISDEDQQTGEILTDADSGKTDSGPPPDYSEYDDSDLPGLDELDTPVVSPPITDSSADESVVSELTSKKEEELLIHKEKVRQAKLRYLSRPPPHIVALREQEESEMDDKYERWMAVHHPNPDRGFYGFEKTAWFLFGDLPQKKSIKPTKPEDEVSTTPPETVEDTPVKTEPDQPIDSSEYDDSDLPGLEPDPPSTDTSGDTISDAYNAPPERKYRVRVRISNQAGSKGIESRIVSQTELSEYSGSVLLDVPPVWDPGETYQDYRRYWYENFGEWFDRELLSIQDDPEKLKNLLNYITDYAVISTVTRERTDTSKEDRVYDEDSFSSEFKKALDEILEDGSLTLLFRKYLGDPEREHVYEIDTTTPKKVQPRYITIPHQSGTSSWLERIQVDDFETVELWGTEPVPESTNQTEIDQKPEESTSLQTGVHGEIKGKTGPIIIPALIDSEDEKESIETRQHELGLNETDIKKLDELYLDFNPPTEKVINGIKITPQLSGQGTLHLSDTPTLKTKLHFKEQKPTKISLPFEHEPIKPSLGQLVKSEISSDNKVDSYYRVYYKPPQSGFGGISLVDTLGNPLYPSEEGDMYLEFDPFLGVPLKSRLPILLETRVSELFKYEEKLEPPETIILLDVKIHTQDE